MSRIAKVCLQSLLKVVNSLLALVGIAMIFYGLWMIRAWERDIEGSSSHNYNISVPWFICTFLVTGVSLCFITCIGHVAADSSNGFCLFCYMLMIILLLLLETAMASDILLNSEWEKDLPEDPTGKFHDFEEFVKSNFDVLKWIGLFIIMTQGLSILLAMALRSMNLGSSYESDEEFHQARRPLINHHARPPQYVIGDPQFASKGDAWTVRIH